MAEDTLPLTWTDEHGEGLGMLYADDFVLFNKLISGQEFILTLVPQERPSPPYWLKLVPTHTGKARQEESYTRTISELQAKVKELEEIVVSKDLEIYELINPGFDA